MSSNIYWNVLKGLKVLFSKSPVHFIGSMMLFLCNKT